MGVVRVVLGVALGVALGLGVVMLGDWLNHMMFPPPADLQIASAEALGEYLASAPLHALLGLPIAWTLAAAVAAFAAAKIGARRGAGWLAGALIFAATLANLIMIPHPAWMLIAAIVFAPLGAAFGAHFGGTTGARQAPA